MARVLLVEDDQNIGELIAMGLRSEGHDAVLVDGYDPAFARLDDQAFDLVITDVMMPGKSGVDLVETLRARPDTAKVPVLMISARADVVEVASRFKKCDALAKPFGMAELLDRVEALLAAED